MSGCQKTASPGSTRGMLTLAPRTALCAASVTSCCSPRLAPCGARRHREWGEHSAPRSRAHRDTCDQMQKAARPSRPHRERARRLARGERAQEYVRYRLAQHWYHLKTAVAGTLRRQGEPALKRAKCRRSVNGRKLVRDGARPRLPWVVCLPLARKYRSVVLSIRRLRPALHRTIINVRLQRGAGVSF